MPGGGNAPNLGRNRPCWCGSGKKFKFCHGNPAKFRPKEGNSDGFAELLSRAIAYEKQREKQQGLGKPITSVSVGGRRHITVGQKVFSSSNWKTFPDFLIAYLRSVFGKEWLKSEASKPLESRHPLLIALEQAKEAAERATCGSTGLARRTLTGAEAFVLDLVSPGSSAINVLHLSCDISVHSDRGGRRDVYNFCDFTQVRPCDLKGGIFAYHLPNLSGRKLT